MPHTPFASLDYLTARSISALARTFSWTPVLHALNTDPNLGSDGEAVGAFSISGLMVTAWARFRWGGADADVGSGFLFMFPPIAEDRVFHLVANAHDYANKVAFGQNRKVGNPGSNYLITGQFDDQEEIGIKFVRSGTNASVSGPGLLGSDRDAFAVTLSYVANPDAMHAFLGVGGERGF